MAVEFIGRWDGRAVSPVNFGEAEVAEELATGADYRCKLTRMSRRSIQQLRMLFALIEIARENSPHPISKDAIKQVLKLRTGHVRTAMLPSGEVIMFPASIALEAMKQDEFNAWFPQALDTLCQDFVPGLSVELARREIHHRAGVAA